MGEKKKRERKVTVPGKRTRKQVGVVKSTDDEFGWRVQSVAGQLRELELRKVAEMLADDAMKGRKLLMMRLLLRLSGAWKEG